ncbi:MAG: fused MFS/spermidine synthase [Pseudomonadales bacterium]
MHGRPRLVTILVAACAGALLATLSANLSARIVHTERSLYNTILVDQRGSVRCLQFSVRRDQRNQSCLDERKPRAMMFAYTRMMMASLLLNPRPARILVVGLGGGTLPMALAELLETSTIDVVEIDPAVDRVAREYFGFEPGERIHVFTQDGRVFVKRAVQHDERYDLILLDAFNGDYIPEHLMTREFLEEVRALLAQGGVLAANTFSISDLYDHESVTYARVFGPFFNLKPWDSGNRVIITALDNLPGPAVLKERAAALAPELAPYGVQPEEMLDLFTTRVDWDTSARPLTDQYSPANLLQGR